MEPKIISFDFDGTLRESRDLQEFAKFLVSRNVPVCITTRRSNDPAIGKEFYEDFPPHEVHDLAEKIGITDINFLSGHYKYTFFKNKSNYIHIDDDEMDIKMIAYERSKGYNDVPCFNVNEIENFKKFVLNEYSIKN